MAAEVTYDGVLRALDAARQNAEHLAAETAKAIVQSQNNAESMQALNMDAKVLSAMADHLDAMQAALDALRRCQETAEQTAAVLKTNHQVLAEAHQAAPVQAADRGFYEG